MEVKEIITKVIDQDQKIVTFEIDKTINFEKDKWYVMDIRSYDKHRTIDQNKMMWGVIHNIAQLTHNDEMDIYISGLEHLEVKYILLEGIPDIEQALKKQFRAVKVIGQSFYDDGTKAAQVYKCYIGSSKFGVREMKKLVDYFLDLEQELLES